LRTSTFVDLHSGVVLGLARITSDHSHQQHYRSSS